MKKCRSRRPPPSLVDQYDVESIDELEAVEGTDEAGSVGVRKSGRIGAQKAGNEEEVEDWEMTSLSELVGKGRSTLRNDQKKVNLASKRKMVHVSDVLEREKSRRVATPTGEKRKSPCVTLKKDDSKLGKKRFGKVLKDKILQISDRKRRRRVEEEEVEMPEDDERIRGRIGEIVEEDGEEVEELTLAEMKTLEVENFQISGRKRGRVALEKEVEMSKNDERKRGRIREVVAEGGEEVEELTLAEMKMKASRKSKRRKDYGKRKMTTTQEVGVHEEVVLNKNRRIYPESEDLEVMTVEDSEFYDFDKDRVERSFKKGQVWAVYDDDDGMPRHYGLIDDVESVNPFAVKMSWLDFQSDGEERLTSWEKRGFHVSCGKFKVARKDNVKLLNIFSHLVGCERVARELYLIYPRKGSIWALYNERTLDMEGRNSPSIDQRGYDIVLFLTSYSESHGLSMAYLDKVDGYKAVFMRREIGYSAVRWLEKYDIRLFSHQIPARKLSGDEAPQLSGDCWELDPASLPQDLLEVE